MIRQAARLSGGKKNRRGSGGEAPREGRLPARWQGTGYVGTGGIVVGDRDGYRAAPRGNCQELRGEIKAAPVFRQPIVGSRDTVPGTVLFIRPPNGGRFRLIGFVSVCQRNRSAAV
jgi:hypothetical protein